MEKTLDLIKRFLKPQTPRGEAEGSLSDPEAKRMARIIESGTMAEIANILGPLGLGTITATAALLSSGCEVEEQQPKFGKLSESLTISEITDPNVRALMAKINEPLKKNKDKDIKASRFADMTGIIIPPSADKAIINKFVKTIVFRDERSDVNITLPPEFFELSGNIELMGCDQNGVLSFRILDNRPGENGNFKCFEAALSDDGQLSNIQEVFIEGNGEWFTFDWQTIDPTTGERLLILYDGEFKIYRAQRNGNVVTPGENIPLPQGSYLASSSLAVFTDDSGQEHIIVVLNYEEDANIYELKDGTLIPIRSERYFNEASIAPFKDGLLYVRSDIDGADPTAEGFEIHPDLEDAGIPSDASDAGTPDLTPLNEDIAEPQSDVVNPAEDAAVQTEDLVQPSLDEGQPDESTPPEDAPVSIEPTYLNNLHIFSEINGVYQIMFNEGETQGSFELNGTIIEISEVYRSTGVLVDTRTNPATIRVEADNTSISIDAPDVSSAPQVEHIYQGDFDMENPAGIALVYQGKTDAPVNVECITRYEAHDPTAQITYRVHNLPAGSQITKPDGSALVNLQEAGIDTNYPYGYEVDVNINEQGRISASTIRPLPPQNDVGVPDLEDAGVQPDLNEDIPAQLDSGAEEDMSLPDSAPSDVPPQTDRLAPPSDSPTQSDLTPADGAFPSDFEPDFLPDSHLSDPDAVFRDIAAQIDRDLSVLGDLPPQEILQTCIDNAVRGGANIKPETINGVTFSIDGNGNCVSEGGTFQVEFPADGVNDSSIGSFTAGSADSANVQIRADGQIIYKNNVISTLESRGTEARQTIISDSDPLKSIELKLQPAYTVLLDRSKAEITTVLKDNGDIDYYLLTLKTAAIVHIYNQAGEYVRSANFDGTNPDGTTIKKFKIDRDNLAATELPTIITRTDVGIQEDASETLGDQGETEEIDVLANTPDSNETTSDDLGTPVGGDTNKTEAPAGSCDCGGVK